MQAIINVLMVVLNIYWWLIIISALMSWLIAFNVINIRNDVVRSVWNFLTQVTEPALRPILRVLPNLGGVDVSPVILLLIILLIQQVIDLYIRPYVF